MSDPLHPSASLLCKLGSVIVHAEEAAGPGGHYLDLGAVQLVVAVVLAIGTADDVQRQFGEGVAAFYGMVLGLGVVVAFHWGRLR